MEAISETYDDGKYLEGINTIKGLTKNQTIFLAAIALVFAEHKEWNTFLLSDAGKNLWDSFSGNEKKPHDTPAQRMLRNSINKRDGEIFTNENLIALKEKEYIYISDDNELAGMQVRGVIGQKGVLALKRTNPDLFYLITDEGNILRQLSDGPKKNNIWDKVCEEKKKKDEEEDDMEFTDFEEEYDDEDWDEEESEEDDDSESPVYQMTPKEIAKELDKTVYSQDEAKKDAALLFEEGAIPESL